MVVKKVKKETLKSTSIFFDKEVGTIYHAGQYITIVVKVDGKYLKRAYSLCTAPYEDLFGITVKRVSSGVVSNFLNDSIQEGDKITVINPRGRFIVRENYENLFLFGAGSGITPLFSILKDQLENAENKIFLFYGNKTKEDTIYYYDLLELQQNYEDRLKIYWFFSREVTGEQYLKGRITPKLLEDYNISLTKSKNTSAYYLCGPEKMIDSIGSYLGRIGINDKSIFFEKFYSGEKRPVLSVDINQITDAKVLLDDIEYSVKVKHSETIIDALIKMDIDAPYSCNQGNCSTCIARVIEGEVTMSKCETLDKDEIVDGYILACQAQPKTDTLFVSFD